MSVAGAEKAYLGRCQYVSPVDELEKRGATVHDGRQRNPSKKLSNREVRSCDVSPKGAANSEPTGVTGYAQIDAVELAEDGLWNRRGAICRGEREDPRSPLTGRRLRGALQIELLVLLYDLLRLGVALNQQLIRPPKSGAAGPMSFSCTFVLSEDGPGQAPPRTSLIPKARNMAMARNHHLLSQIKLRLMRP